MQMCPFCGKVYDESEYSKCPVCHPDSYGGSKMYIVYDRDLGCALELTEDELEEFKKTHPEYQ
ncbi:hypothetical protein IJZ97_00650 [bacterium]|nr:hypothetical protein [bacterium]